MACKTLQLECHFHLGTILPQLRFLLSVLVYYRDNMSVLELSDMICKESKEKSR